MVKKATEAVSREDEAIESLIAQVIQLYSNLLAEDYEALEQGRKGTN